VQKLDTNYRHRLLASQHFFSFLFINMAGKFQKGESQSLYAAVWVPWQFMRFLLCLFYSPLNRIHYTNCIRYGLVHEPFGQMIDIILFTKRLQRISHLFQIR